MNYYIVVEGARTERRLFSAWIPLINPALTQVDFATELVGDNRFLIVSGGGFPAYEDVVRNGARDVQGRANCPLIVSVDAEDDDADEKRDRMNQVVDEISPTIPRTVVIQNCCVESWLLGNRRVVALLPRTQEMRDWKAFYDARTDCPELMPAHAASERNRAQTALRYLISAIRERTPQLIYSKSNPRIACEATYLDQLRLRMADTGQLNSFASFVACFQPFAP